MALTNYRRISLFPTDYATAGNSGLSFSLNNTTNKWAAGFIVSEAITIAKVAFYVHSETGTSPAYDVRIETDDGTGRPSGTLAWANASANFTVSAAGWTAELSLTASGAVSPGTLYHLVVQPSGTPDGSNFIAMRENGMAIGGMVSAANGVLGISGYLPCYAQRYTGSWANGSGAPVFVLANSDGSLRMGQVMDNSNLYTITDTAWKGIKFVAPATMTVWGACINKLNSASAGAVAAKLIDGSNNILATGTIPAGYFDVITHRQIDLFVFDSPVEITQGDTYRCVWKDPAGNQRFDASQCTSATFKAIKPGTDQYMLTEGTSADGSASPTSWTDSDDEEALFVLHGSSVEAGGGGGGGALLVPIGMAGGFN